MGNVNQRKCSIWCIGCAVGLFVVASMTFLVGITEHHKSHAYARSNCLVKSSHWEKCGVYRKTKGPAVQCYEGQWLVQFQDKTEEETTIAGLRHFQEQTSDSYNDNRTLPSLNTYMIGHTYPCYHSTSNRLKETQFDEPSLRNSIIILIIGCILLLLGVCSLVIAIRYFHSNGDHSSDQKTQRDAAAVETVSIEEENTPLSPPQSHTTAPAYELEKKGTNV